MKHAKALGLHFAALFLLYGCATTSGSYVLTAHDASGNNLSSNMILTAEGSGIYTVRNGLCIRYPGSVIRIKDINTGEELKSDSPYQCK